MHTMVWHEFFCRSLFLQIGDFCFVLWGLIFVINKTDFLFLLPGINFGDFQKVPDRPLIIFLFLWSMCNRNTYFQTILQSATRCLKPVIHHTMFCFSGKFKLDYLQNYSGLHFSGKNVIFFTGTHFCGSLEKSQKSQIRTYKKIVPRGSYALNLI